MVLCWEDSFVEAVVRTVVSLSGSVGCDDAFFEMPLRCDMSLRWVVPMKYSAKIEGEKVSGICRGDDEMPQLFVSKGEIGGAE